MTSTTNTNKTLVNINESDYETVQQYRLALLTAIKVAKDKLAKTAENKMNTEDLIKDCSIAVRMFLNQEINESEMEYILNKYDFIKDKLTFSKDIKTALVSVLSEYELGDDFDFFVKVCTSNSTTLRKMKTNVVQLKKIIEMIESAEAGAQEVYEVTEELEQVRTEAKELRRQLDAIYVGYCSDELSSTIVLKYKKLKEDGLTDTEICKIFDMSRPTLTKLVKHLK